MVSHDLVSSKISPGANRSGCNLELLVGSVDWLVPIGWRLETHLSWDADILIGDPGSSHHAAVSQSLSLFSAAGFAARRATVLVVIASVRRRWRTLSRIRPGQLAFRSNWRRHDPKRSPASRREAQLETGGPELPSRHDTTLGVRLRGKNRRFYFDLEAQFLSGLLGERGRKGYDPYEDYQPPGSTRYLAVRRKWGYPVGRQLFRNRCPGMGSPRLRH